MLLALDKFKLKRTDERRLAFPELPSNKENKPLYSRATAVAGTHAGVVIEVCPSAKHRFCGELGDPIV